LPPGLAEPQDGQPEIPPEAQQKIAQLTQMVELLTKELQAKTQIVETKQQELDSNERIAMAKIQAGIREAQIKAGDHEELDSRERIEMAKINARRQEKLLKLDSQEAIELLKAEIEGIKARIDMNLAHLAAQAGAAAQEM